MTASPAGAAAPIWRDVVGQSETIATLTRAVSDPSAMTHAWLFTGPPGSGRSNAAIAFAATRGDDDPGAGGTSTTAPTSSEPETLTETTTETETAEPTLNRPKAANIDHT